MQDKDKEQQAVLLYQDMKPAIMQVIAGMEQSRTNAIEKMPDDARLRRNPYDALLEQGLLTPENITLQWDAIQHKQSRLPASQRKLVVAIVEDAMQRVIIKRAREKQQAEKQQQ